MAEESVKKSIYHKLSGVLWGGIVVLVVLLAIYVSVGRMLAAVTGAYQQPILQELNHRLPFTLDADSVSAEWHSFTPVLVLGGLRLTTPGESGHSLELSGGRIAVDVAGSLLTRALQFTNLSLDGLQLAGEVTAQGQLQIRGLGGGDTPLGGWLEDLLLNIESVALSNSHLDLAFPTGEQRELDFDLALTREGSRRRLEGSLVSARGLRVRALAEGVGNPFELESFAGNLYLDISASDVAGVTDLMQGSIGGVEVDGSLEVELWSNWDGGQPTAEIHFQMHDMNVRGGSGAWEVPLGRVAFEASLFEQKGGWGMSMAQLELEQEQVSLRVPRLQVAVRGETLQVRALEVPLAPLGFILAGMESLPAAATDLIRILQPRGTLPALQLRVTDFTAPAADWGLDASFRELAVESWHGAPGISGANGYVELSPGHGAVLLDSKQFSMAFPTVYRGPLDYEDFLGTINIAWDPTSVTLASSLVEAVGPEGPVRVLFGLSIPLQESEVGLEMDLLVGLEALHPDHREKYIPYILSEDLRTWLSASIGDGEIEQGGFLWRGSLQSDDSSQHTVQLFFNIRDTMLDYHPDWPPLVNVDGTVLIDDSRVSVWADHVTLLDSRAESLSVELWPDKDDQLWLAVDGSLAGPAADGLAVVNTSPLGQIVGQTFAEWELAGNLTTDLNLRLNLNDPSVPPQVDVTAQFEAVDLDIIPGKLPIRGINGALAYSTRLGFSSVGLSGKLWGRPLQAEVVQNSEAKDPSTPDSSPATAVEISSTVDISDVSDWLDLKMLGFGGGRAAVDVVIELVPDSPPLLRIDSELAGVSLNLPAPWGKSAETERKLHVDLSLGGVATIVGVEFEGGLRSELELFGGRLRAGTLAFGGESPELEPGVIRVSGQTEAVDLDEWRRFIGHYFVSDSTLSSDESSANPQLEVSVDQLQVGQLVIGGRELGAVQLSLSEEAADWRVSADAEWLRGELLYVPGGQSRLDIQHLDLAGLDRLDLAGDEAGEIIELPDVAVSLAGLRRGDNFLGQLAFMLHSDGTVLTANTIIGELAAMQLLPEQPARLVWHQGVDSRTELEAWLHFQDLGQTLKQLGYERIIETEEGSFELALNWPGAPQDFSLHKGVGSMRVDVGKGRFPDVSGGASGTLRVVSILNLAEIVRRLSLSHMFESGVSFDTVDGEVYFRGGTIEMAKMEIQGGASSFQFSGTSEVASRSLDGELVVTLPVANNLPWVAALTAGLPVAAGVFLLSKVFENQVNRLTSAVYSATGTWDDPKVKFDRVFDDTAPAGVVTSGERPDAVQAESP